MDRFRRALTWLIAIGSTIVGRGIGVAAAAYLGYWAFPAYLAVDLVAAFFIVWLHGESAPRDPPWLAKKFRVSEAGFTHASALIRALAYLGLLLIALVLGTLFAAAFIRGIGFRGKSAYKLAAAITVPASLFWTGVYYGFVLSFKNFFV